MSKESSVRNFEDLKNQAGCKRWLDNDPSPCPLKALARCWQTNKPCKSAELVISFDVVEAFLQGKALVDRGSCFAKIQRLCDLWVSHIEAVDHQLENPYYFQLARLTREEKTEFATILKELLDETGQKGSLEASGKTEAYEK